MSHRGVRVRRDALAPCMTCPICHKLFREAATIIECLHTFCKKCIYKKLSDEEMDCCPICNIDLGCLPLEKLRPDHNMQDVRAKIFPYKRIKVKTPEISTPFTLPSKRKERSLSSLVVSTPRILTQSGGMTGRRSKSIARKTSKGSSFIIERHVKREEEEEDEQPQSSSSLVTPKKITQNLRQNSAAGQPFNRHSPDKIREDQPETFEGKTDFWKPLNCLVEAANTTKSSSSKVTAQGRFGKLEALDSEVLPAKSKNRDERPKSKVQEENKNFRYPNELERPKKMCKARQKKAKKFGEFKVPQQVVIDADSAKFGQRNYPIWFSLVSDEQEGNARFLPQISTTYLRIKDGRIPVSFIQKYLKMKLNLTSEDEVEMKCMGQPVVPTLSLNNLIDEWLRTATSERVSATVGSSAKDFVMVLGYARKAPES